MEELIYKDDLLRLVAYLTTAVRSIRQYSPGHPLTKRSLTMTYRHLTDLIRARREITCLIIDDDLVIDGRPLRSNPSASQFMRLLKERDLQRISFLDGVLEEDLASLLHCLTTGADMTGKTGDAIKIGKVVVPVDGDTMEEPDGEGTDSDRTETIIQARDAMIDELKSLYADAKRMKRIDVSRIDRMIRIFAGGMARGLNPVSLLISLKSADEYTFTHVVNVCILTMSQAETLGFDGDHLYNIGIASLLHDVGKLFVPDEIMKKPGGLTEEERRIVETHTINGARYILQLSNIPKLAVLGALEHHIRFDGTGYPLMKQRWQPNVVSQMIAVSDVFDALRSRRCYSEPKPQELIIKILNDEKGTAFHPHMVDNFLRMISRHG